mmetsp:Transcript_10437/g.15090  ORF Transcript_10437/g.15090 Transcript_10437/m.15090 type:complete len:172 (-) Transcript_10437:128-643(-)
MDTMKNGVKGFKRLAGMEVPDEEKSFTQQIEDEFECLSLTRTQRLYGFAICFVLGWVISLLSTFSVAKPKQFAILYSLGNIIALSSSFFLMGPCKQLKSMFKPVRAVATTVYLVCLAMTIVSALEWPDKIVIIIAFMVAQCCAAIWYCLSYIPFGRAMMKKCLAGCCSACV